MAIVDIPKKTSNGYLEIKPAKKYIKIRLKATTLGKSIMSNTSNSDTPSWDSETKYVGCVKWFNNKAGYGFLTVMDGDKKGEDVFCHHSGVCVNTEQYKYLVQGEYVSFTLRESDSGSHPYQAGNIAGVCGGKLMCETRAENRQSRETGEEGESTEHRPAREHRNTRDTRRSRPRGGGPREDGATWMLVRTDEGNNRRGSGQGRGPRRPREPRD